MLSEKSPVTPLNFIFDLENNASAIAKSVKGDHWGIENSLHWCLDMTLREDHFRVGKFLLKT